MISRGGSSAPFQRVVNVVAGFADFGIGTRGAGRFEDTELGKCEKIALRQRREGNERAQF